MPDESTTEIQIPLPGRYRVRRVLGSGGMATVYLADDVETGREVAVKVMKPDLVSAQAVERFLREIRMTHELEHPHIVPILQAGEAGGVPFFVMPRIPGLTLRQRLQRERQLPVAEVVRVTTALAAALAFAHERNVIHRDVKPENVLLDGERVYLTDFGIARAVSEAGTDRLTESGLAIGTAGYMSPEQASGERTIDARSDIYSLACVVYEMLAGEPPFTGATPHAIIAKQMNLEPPALAIVRPRLPDGVDDVLRQALARTPADRFPAIELFAAELDEVLRGAETRAHRVRRLVRTHRGRIAIGSALAMTAFVVGRGPVARWFDADATPDPFRVAVLPIVSDDHALRTSITELVRAEVGRFAELEVVDSAASAQPGRIVTGAIVTHTGGPSLQLRLLGGLRRDSVLSESRLDIATGAPDRAVIRGLLWSLFLPGIELHDDGDGTQSLAARAADARARAALERWDLGMAVSGFAEALQRDSAYSQAQLGLAVARLFAGSAREQWHFALQQAASGPDILSDQQRVMLRALRAHAADDLASACGDWRALSQQEPGRAMLRVMLAHCLMSDDIVVADSRSPSGWSFRSSYHAALREYEEAFLREPAILQSFGTDAALPLPRLFRTGGQQLRRGRGLASSDRFGAFMEWRSDTLAFVAIPLSPQSVLRVRDADAHAEAVRRQRERVRRIAATWATAFPESPDARFTLALALASLGDASGLDTLEAARAYVRGAAARSRLAAAELGLRLAFALRDGDTISLIRVRTSADSLLLESARRPAGDPVFLASVAALRGRSSEVSRFARDAALYAHFGVPEALRDGVPALLVFAALGGPADSLRRLELRIRERIDHAMRPGERTQRRLEFLARGASMAYPLHRFASLAELARDGDPIVSLQVRADAGDTIAVRDALRSLGRQRQGNTPDALALDGVAPEAELWLSIGDAQAAAAWLDPVLTALPQRDPGLLSSPLLAAALVRALDARARAAAGAGDHRAERQWRTAVRILRAGGEM